MFKPSSLHCSLVVSLSGPFRARFSKMRLVRCARTCSSLTLAVWTAWPEASLVLANWSRRASWRKPWKQGAHIKQLAFKQYHMHLTPCWMLHMPSAYANGAISAVETVNRWGIRPGRPRRWPRRSRTARHPSRRSRPTPWRPPSPRPPAASRTEPLSFNRPLHFSYFQLFSAAQETKLENQKPSKTPVTLFYQIALEFWKSDSWSSLQLVATNDFKNKAFSRLSHFDHCQSRNMPTGIDWMHWGEHVWTGVFGAAHQSVHLKRDCVLLRHLSFMKNMKTDHNRSLFSSQWAERERSHCFAERRCTVRKLLMADLQLLQF